ncbi:hypothetical protein [uncultured Ilumatobacter sp.]|uniref:hypothetical protein n=1 Tax=uncultured Ilumatobacter sp. TaxID=879968 RepID=UPI00374F72B5
MIRLDAATVLLQWATGGMLFCWFTTRRRVIGVGYGWLLRGTYLCFAGGALAAGSASGFDLVRDISSALVALACLVALVVSIVRKGAGVSGEDAEFDRRTERVAAMTGIDRDVGVSVVRTGSEFNPTLDLLPVAIGFVGLIAAAVDATDGASFGTLTVALLRTLIGAAFIGAIGDGMLLGHWYLVQPGLPRKLLNEMVTALIWLWPLEVGALLLPTGMISVWLGTVDDGWGGLLGWMWGMCAISTIILVLITRAALKERYYSAVMAATGLLYLAILTAFGTDIVARAVLDQT